MEKQAVVKSVQGSGTFDFNDKTYYKFEIEMENGDVGTYNSMSADQQKFIEGNLTNYIFDQSNAKYPKIKPVYGFTGSPKRNGDYQNRMKANAGNDVQEKIVRQSMLKASVDFWAIDPKLKPSVEDVLKVAKQFIDFVNQKAEPQFSEEFTKVEKGGDLPF